MRRSCTRMLAFEDWPLIDQEAWSAGTRSRGLFDPKGCGARWGDASHKKYRGGYGQWLNYLSSKGALDHSLAPGERVTASLVREYFEFLRCGGLSDHTLVNRLDELFRSLMAMEPNKNWRWIIAPNGRSIRSQMSMRRKIRTIPSIRSLLDLGVHLMDKASERVGPSRQLCQFRDGLIFALLAACPFRRRNISMIEIGRHLIRLDDRYVICFTAAETKTGRRDEKPVLPFLTSYLQTYLDRVRPKLLQGRETSALWINWNGIPMNTRGVESRLDVVGHRELGARIGFNMFRYAAATDVSIITPAHVGIIAPLLGHTDRRTGEKHYNRANAVSAATQYHSTLRSLRRPIKRTKIKSV